MHSTTINIFLHSKFMPRCGVITYYKHKYIQYVFMIVVFDTGKPNAAFVVMQDTFYSMLTTKLENMASYTLLSFPRD